MAVLIYRSSDTNFSVMPHNEAALKITRHLLKYEIVIITTCANRSLAVHDIAC